MPVDPTAALATGVRDMATTGAEWSVGGVEGLTGGAEESAGGSFGDMLTGSLDALSARQTEAAGAARALATGQASDVSEVVMAVERARLSMQLASQIRTRGVEAYQDIFRTTV